MSEQQTTLEIPLNQPLELIALAVKDRAIRCKILATGQPITLRTSIWREIAGEILTVQPSRVWKYKTTKYLTGKVVSSRIDIPALGLTPLALKDEEVWNPNNEYWGEPENEIDPYFKPIIDFGSRPSYEMEQVIPFYDDDEFNDPITEASDLRDWGDYDKACKIMEKLLVADLRCLDAHAHLGNWLFNGANSEITIDDARRHYEVGVKIGTMSLGQGFTGLLPWGRIDNRPFLRCFHGYGLCLWRLGKPAEARRIFEKMLWLNPSDNQGIRFLLADIDKGMSWEEVEH